MAKKLVRFDWVMKKGFAVKQTLTYLKGTFLSCKTHKSGLFFAVFFILWTAAYAQHRQNPAEKYKDAYKKYVNARCPIPKDSIQHFVYFSRDRESIINHPLLTHVMFKGAQIMYAWKDLEPQEGEYDFSQLQEDYAYLKQHDKKLFVQIQDVTFNPHCFMHLPRTS